MVGRSGKVKSLRRARPETQPASDWLQSVPYGAGEDAHYGAELGEEAQADRADVVRELASRGALKGGSGQCAVTFSGRTGAVR